MNFRGGNGGGGRPTNPGGMDLIEDNMNKSMIPVITCYRYHGEDQHIEQVGRIHQEDKHEHQEHDA